MFGLVKMAPTFISIFGDITTAFTGDRGEEFIENKGWYEWPLTHTGIHDNLVLCNDNHIPDRRFPLLPSAIFAMVLIFTTFLLGAIAVRVMGETGIEPVSGTSFIVLLMLLLIFLNADVGLDKEESVLIALVGTTVFGSAISMSGTVVGDYKQPIYRQQALSYLKR